MVEWPFATPTIGFSKSASPKPTARSMARFGERATPWVMSFERRFGAESRVAIVSSYRCSTIIASHTWLSSDRGHPRLREHPRFISAPIAQSRRRPPVARFLQAPCQVLRYELARVVAFVAGRKFDGLEAGRGQMRPLISSRPHIPPLPDCKAMYASSARARAGDGGESRKPPQSGLDTPMT